MVHPMMLSQLHHLHGKVQHHTCKLMEATKQLIAMMRAEEEAASIKMIAEMQGQQGGLSGLSNAEEEAASAQMIAEMQRQEGQKQDAASAKLVAEMRRLS